MNILVIGRGGREHSIVRKLAESKQITKLYAAPGNAGMEEATTIPIQETEFDKLVEFVRKNEINFTVVGPENPLLLGIANRFQEENLAIFAPTREAALIEGSKDFAKAFMMRHHIPTASYQTFTDAEKAKNYVKEKGVPIVIKADGLAAGKGVVVAETEEEALLAIEEMLVSKKYADASSSIVIEEFLDGDEFSLMAFVNGEKVFPMITARDHKRAYDGDKGPNTGGMGAYAPVQNISEETVTFATEEILQKTASGLVQEGRSFMGVLYAGIMMTNDGPKVIEFNARFGDPETQVVLPLLKNDLFQVLLDVHAGINPHLEWEASKCVGVVVAAKGYPAAYEENIQLPILANEKTYTIYAGVKKVGNQFVSNGGRVLLVGAKDASYQKASEAVYHQLNSIHKSAQLFYRCDIGINLKEFSVV